MVSKNTIKVITLLVSIITFIQISANEFNLGKIIAYPNPFSPETDVLTIKPESSSTFNGSVEFKVYNFNEKEVFAGQAANSQIIWNGHTADGKRLLPGLYFIKIIQTRSDLATGSKIIKIIVQ